MANDREFSVILKATDLSTQPIQQVLDAVKKLTEAQKQNNEAAAQGAVTAKEFGDGLKTLLAGAQGLTGAQTGLQRFLDQQKLVAKLVNDLAAAKDKLDAKRGEVAPGTEPTDKQANAIQRLEKAFASLQGRSDSANASLQTMIASLEKMGVAADLSDRRATQLASAREKALQAVLAAQEKLDAKIAASPAEGERTKAQEYSIRRVADALTNAQAKAEQAGAAFASYQNVKLNEAVVQAQVKLRTELEALTPVVQRANVETLSLTENRNKAAAAAAAQAEIEKRAAAEIEAASREAVAQREAQNRQAIAAEDERINALVGAAARQKALYDADQKARQENYNRELAQVKEQEAAESRLTAKREADAKERQKFQQASYAQLFTPVLDQADAEEKNRVERDKAAKQEQIEAEKALAAVRVAENHRAVEAEDARVAALLGAAHRAIAITEEERAAREKAYNEEQAAATRIAAAQKQAAEDEIKFRRDQKQALYENLFTPVHAADVEAVKQQKAAEDDLAKARAKAALEQQTRLEALRESQGKIGDAIARTPGTQPLGVSAEPPANFSNLSEQLQAILAPAEAARQTLGGVSKQIGELGAVLEGPKLRTQDYDKALRSLAAALIALQRIGGLVDSYRAQEAATAGLAAALGKEKATRDAMVTLYERTKVYDEQQVANINRQVALVAKLSAEFNRENESLAGLRSGLEAAGINFEFLDLEIQRMIQTAQKGKVAFDGLKGNSSSAGKEFTFLGLRPYELQNLSYQINDVFTQLGSGTPITQVFAQQSGQIFQLFQRQLVGVLGSLRAIPFALPAIAVGIAALTTGIFTFIRAIEVLEQKRAFTAALKLDVDGARYSVEGLVATAKDMDRFGVSLADAGKAARELTTAGISQERIAPLLRLSAQFADARNQKFPEAVKQVLAAFSGTGSDLLKYATQIEHLLTLDEFKRIRDMTETGDIVAARAEVMDIALRKSKEAADANLSGIAKAFRELGKAWKDLLDSLAENVVVNWFGTRIINDLRVGIGLIADMIRAAKALSELDFPNLHRALSGQPSIPNTPAQPGQAGVKVNNEGGGQGAVGMFQLRTAAAQDVGLTPEERFDYTKNIRGGVDYLRQKLEEFGGDLDAATRAYKEGKGGALQGKGFDYLRDVGKQNVATLDPKAAQDILTQFSTVFATYAKQADIPKILDRVMQIALQESGGQHFNAGAKPVTETGRTTTGQELTSKPTTPRTAQEQREASERQKIATEAFERAENERRMQQEADFRDEEDRQRIHAYKMDVIIPRETNERAQKEAADKGAEKADPEAVRRQIIKDQDVEEAKYHAAWLQRQEERAAKYAEIARKALDADKTNYEGRKQLLDLEQKQDDANLERRKAHGEFNNAPPGQSYEDVRRLQTQGQNQAQQNLREDVAKAVVDAVNDTLQKQLKEIQEKAKTAGPGEQARYYAEQTALVQQFAPKITAALRRSDELLSQGPQTEGVQRQRARNDLLRQQVLHPELLQTGEQQAATAASAPLEGAIKQNKAQLDIITDSVKIGGVAASAAIEQITDFGKKSLASMRSLVGTTNGALQAIANDPSTTPQRRTELETEIKRNQLASSQAAVDIQNAILAVLAEDKARLDKAIEEYKKAVADLDNKIRDGRLSPLQAAAERARIDAENIPKIAQAGQTYRADSQRAQQGAEQLGLSPGFRAGLSAEAQRAATESDPRTLNSQSQKDAATQLLASAKQAESITTETARTQADLLKLHATTQTAAEAAIKESFAQANAELDKQAPAIEKLIHDMEAVGNVQGAKKLAADWALVRAQMQYIDPLTQQIIQGFEQSFVSHATQAFDTIAKSIADVAVNGGKLKDVWKAVGNGFANMAAGILSDIAKIIIKYELLKLVNDALGTNIPTGASGSGGSTGSGIGSILGSLFGSSASAAFGTTTATAAGAVSADTILEAAPLAAGLILHSGGTIGTPGGMSKVVDLSVFREAQRYHSGGPVLASDEVPIIAQRGEKIVSLAQQRQEQAAATAQANGAGGSSIRNVLAVGDKEIAGAMNSSHGEKVILNVLQRNAPTVKKYVG